MATDLRNLDYAPRPPKHWRVVRRIAWLLLAAALSWAAWRWGRPMWNQCRYLYWQHKAMVYTAAPGQVAFEMDPNNAASLLATSGDYQAVPRIWGSQTLARETYASLWPKCVRSLFPYPFDGIAFLHERRSPDGQRRLVVAYFYVACNYTGPDLQFAAADIWKPAGWRPGSRAVKVDASGRGVGLNLDPATDPIKIFMGVSDPEDESHFTIKIMVSGARRGDPPEPFILDGWLRDGSTIDVRPRHSATAARIAKDQPGRPDW